MFETWRAKALIKKPSFSSYKELASASRQGVWSREGSIYSFLSLDDVSDGNQYLCITEMDVNTDQVEMRFYAK